MFGASSRSPSMALNSWHHHIRPLSGTLLLAFPLLLVACFFAARSSPFSALSLTRNPSSLPASRRGSVIWSANRLFEWRPCGWWNAKVITALPARSNGYVRIDCYGGLNQMRRDFCDGVGIARLLNATLVLPKFEVAAYWNESSIFEDIFDVDYFIQETKGFVEVVKEFPDDLASKEPFKVDCSKRKGNFDYVEAVLPELKKHHYISITPAMSQRRDRYPLYAKAALCQSCYRALRLNKALEAKAMELFDAIPKPFLSLHLRFEPDMVAYSQCEYSGLSPSSLAAIDSARGDRKPYTGDAAIAWRNRGKCPLTPAETAFILQSLSIPTNTNIYLAAGDGLMEIEGLTGSYTNVFSKSSFLDAEDFVKMHGNTKAALDYYISINSDGYIATYFGNMDKMVSAMRVLNGMYKTLFLSRRAFANYSEKGMKGEKLADALWREHFDDFVNGRGFALPECFCEFKLIVLLQRGYRSRSIRAWGRSVEAMAALHSSALIASVYPRSPERVSQVFQRSLYGGSVSSAVEVQISSSIGRPRNLSSSSASTPWSPLPARYCYRSVRCEAAGEGSSESFDGTVYKGIYGPWTIEPSDVREVILYRSGLVTAASSFVLAACSAFLPEDATFREFLKQNVDFIYVAGAGGLGLSLLLIHIYVTPIKRFLQALWAIGVFGSAATYLYLANPLDEGLVQYVIENPSAIWFVGPLFAALTGLVFKEGLCYGKLEAGVLTFIIPILLLGHLTGLMDNGTKLNLLGLWMALFVVFAARKFQQPIKDDIGDKSVFIFNALPEADKDALIKKLQQKNDGLLD